MDQCGHWPDGCEMQRARTSCCKSDDGEGSAQFAHDFAITGTVENGEFQVVRCKVCAGWGDAGHGATAAPRLTQRNNHRAAIGHAEAVSPWLSHRSGRNGLYHVFVFLANVPDAISTTTGRVVAALLYVSAIVIFSVSNDKRRRNSWQHPVVISSFPLADSHLKCKAGFCENFEWSEIVESLSRSIVEPVRDVCKGVV